MLKVKKNIIIIIFFILGKVLKVPFYRDNKEFR